MGLKFERTAYRHLQVADHNDLDLTEWAWTLCGRPDALPASGEEHVLLQKGDDDLTSEASNYRLLYYESGGSYYLQGSFVDTGGTERATTYTVTLTVDRWYSIMLSWDNATKDLTLYLAAREAVLTDADATYTEVSQDNHAGATPRTNTRALIIGAGMDDSGVVEKACGWTFSEVALYLDAITKGTADGRLTTRLTGQETSLVTYWPLDDGVGGAGGSTAYDRAGSGHSATLVNHPTWSDDPVDLYYATGIHGRNAVVGYCDPLSHYDAINDTAPSIVGSDDETGREADFLLSPRSEAVTRTADASGAKTWVFDFARPTPVSMVVIGGHSFTSAATITLALHTADAWGGADVTETVTWQPSPIYHFLARPYQYRYMRLSVTDAANGDGYLELGVVRPFALWEASQPGDMTNVLALDDLSAVVETPHGDRTTRAKAKPRAYSMELSSLPVGEARELTRVLRALGNGGYVWICPDPQRHLRRYGVYGVLTADYTESPAEPADNYRHLRRLTVTEDVP